ncbi:CaiB/BaiF CoA transferase family protein [Paenibacillus ferrarius]|uniref:CaiB/BaiF CoA transferase family protein n=1 Tax=Paenibacillus ferrarius TaxID=1469647 RepID=UPI003D2E2BB2
MLVLDFSQFLSGPYAGLRLADLGARVIKIERSDGGDICRRLYISNLELDGDSTLFHSINRNKESYAVDLKDEVDRNKLKKLLKHADVMIQNFRPGVIEKLGFGYEEVRTINSRLVYGSISGYGKEGPLVKRPGQDLLVQSIVGLPWLQRSRTRSGPIPFGLAIADMMTGSHLAQGILAVLVRRAVSNCGALVEVSLLESTLDALQELWMERQQAQVMESGSAGAAIRKLQHSEHELPAGLYRVKDGYIAIDRVTLSGLSAALGVHRLMDESHIASLDAVHELLMQHPATYWLERLRQAGLVCGELWNWQQLVQHEGFRQLDMTRQVRRPSGAAMTALTCPIKLNGQRLDAGRGAPLVGEHNAWIESEWKLGRQM